MKEKITVYIVTMMLNRTVWDSVKDEAVQVRQRGIFRITTNKQKAQELTAEYQDLKAHLQAKNLDSSQLSLLLADNIDNWAFDRHEFSDLKRLFAA